MINKKNISSLIRFHNGIEQFNYDLTVDWAIDLLKSGIETDNILMLASFSKPVNSEEVKPYLSAVLSDFKIEEKEGDEAIFALINYYTSNIISDNSIRSNLNSLYELFLEKNSSLNNDQYGLMPFYLLYHSWGSLEEIGENFYYKGVDMDNIEERSQLEAKKWIDKYINGIENSNDYKSTSSDSKNIGSEIKLSFWSKLKRIWYKN